MSEVAQTEKVDVPQAQAQAPGTKRSKVVLWGCLLGLALFVLAVACLEFALPSQASVREGIEYGYVYSGAKSGSVDFVEASSAADSVLVFGSSELSTPSSVIPEVPVEVFGANDYGIQLMLIGEAYDQSLWQSMAAVAHGSKAANKKVVLIVSPTWFEDEGLDSETFKLRFSYELYREFCANPAISSSSKAYLTQRLKEMGIDQMTIDAGMGQSPIAFLNDAVLSGIEDLRVRASLLDVRERGIERASEDTAAEVDWAAWYAQAYADAQAMATNNDWGMDDAFYTENIAGRLERLKSAQTGERFSNQAEYQDFSFLLKVCKEVGLEPLVIISPVHGPFYDWVGTDAADRQKCYNRIEEICASHDVPCESFASAEYENYFLHDIVHFGWTGWVAVEEAIYNYVKD